MTPLILRNTLLTKKSIERILTLPEEEGLFGSLLDILTRFQDIKKFASEIHTEIHLVKPILKTLGYAYESKPKYFEENVKDPDVALFATEEERVKDSPLWGTKEYYNNTLGIVLLKRYGRNLYEGISGFYLEFENKMPIYQMLYLLKKSRTPWGILTNGKHWTLVKRPIHFEKRIIEIDLEGAVFEEEKEVIHLFYHIFSCMGLIKLLPNIIEGERKVLIDKLTEKKAGIQKTLQDLKKKVDVYPIIIDAYSQFFPGWKLPCAELYLNEKGAKIKERTYARTDIINNYDHMDIFSYLFNKKENPSSLNLDEIVLREKGRRFTKEDIFSLKILDFTPGFGNITTQLADSLAYTSFVLPYKEKNTFRAEWEEESALKKCIVDTILYGIERSHIAFDILQNTIGSRFGCHGGNYRLGNPLIGMSLKDIINTLDSTNQMGLFNKHPREIILDFKEMYRHFYSLSDKIKEDVEIKNEIKARLKIYTTRIRDVMDVITATYFTKTVENRKIQEMLFNLDSNESAWDALRDEDWFIESKEIAKINGFFHLELEFPFLLSNNFDFIFVQAALNYSWEEELPVVEATKAYIKKGMTYLKQDGKMVIISKDAIDQLIPELKKSKRYEVESIEGICILKKKI
ncbi:MAG: hypothetical protein C0392_12700 [Syntrophus sp. (in: bacteria)]|nr:hypothetical protein [Syntrophus sp. (in: bacteria)]